MEPFKGHEPARSMVKHWNYKHGGVVFKCFSPKCSSKFTKHWSRRRHILGKGDIAGSAECRVAIAQFPDYEHSEGLELDVYEKCKGRLLEDLRTLVSKEVLTLAEIERDFSQFYDILSAST